ncbi:MAG: GNAT family N-acetyltransferase [Bacteroidota bacterium]
MHIRPLTPADLAFHLDMFYQSLFVPEGGALYPRDMLEEPHLRRYHQNYLQQAGDFGLIAEVEDEKIGACWVRFFPAADPGYGFVEEAYPELGIALVEAQRGKGIGTALMKRMFAKLQVQGVTGVSLSADTRNAGAVRLYRHLGFRETKREDHAITMLLPFD